MIIYPKPLAGSQVPIESVISLVKQTLGIDIQVTVGGLKVCDCDVSDELIILLKENKIPFDKGNVSFGQQLRDEGFYIRGLL